MDKERVGMLGMEEVKEETATETAVTKLNIRAVTCDKSISTSLYKYIGYL